MEPLAMSVSLHTHSRGPDTPLRSKPSLIQTPEAEVERVPVVYAISPADDASATAAVFGWTGEEWQALPMWGEWQPTVHTAFAVIPKGGAFWLAAASTSKGGAKPWVYRENFGVGEAPPGLLGQATVDCRIQLQCRRAGASDNSSSDFGPGMLTNNYHCGWFTRIPDADPLRLGTDLQAEFKLRPAHGGILDWDGDVRAVIFDSDLGYRPHDSRYMFLNFDSNEPHDLNIVGGTMQHVCDTARKLRRAAWDYDRRSPRPYDLRGQWEPNSNSFLGAAAFDAGFLPSPDVPPANDDGNYPGWHYWRRVSRHWRTDDF